MTGLFEPLDEGELSAVERDPRMLEFAMRQRKALSAFTAKQAQQYVQMALQIRKELDRERDHHHP